MAKGNLAPLKTFSTILARLPVEPGGQQLDGRFGRQLLGFTGS